jgi:deoxyribonuclease V
MADSISLIAGFDAAYSRNGRLQAGAWAFWSHQKKRLVEWANGWKTDPPPYIPGRFYLRECALAIEWLSKLETKPDLLLIDGHGKAHPEGHGLTCHIG